jgi:hypothetical protein
LLDGLVLAAPAAGFGGTLAILREIAGVVPSTASAAAVLAAVASGLGCARRIVGEITAAVLAACMPGARGLLAILGEVAGIAGMSLVCHVAASFFLIMIFCTMGIFAPALGSTALAEAG